MGCGGMGCSLNLMHLFSKNISIKTEYDMFLCCSRGTRFLLQLEKKKTKKKKKKKTNNNKTNKTVTSPNCFLHHMIEQLLIVYDGKKMLGFRATIFIPCDKMYGYCDGSAASSTDLPQRDYQLCCIMTIVRNILFQSAFKTLDTVFENIFHPKLL